MRAQVSFVYLNMMMIYEQTPSSRTRSELSMKKEKVSKMTPRFNEHLLRFNTCFKLFLLESTRFWNWKKELLTIVGWPLFDYTTFCHLNVNRLSMKAIKTLLKINQTRDEFSLFFEIVFPQSKNTSTHSSSLFLVRKMFFQRSNFVFYEREAVTLLVFYETVWLDQDYN